MAGSGSAAALVLGKVREDKREQSEEERQQKRQPLMGPKKVIWTAVLGRRPSSTITQFSQTVQNWSTSSRTILEDLSESLTVLSARHTVTAAGDSTRRLETRKHKVNRDG